MTDQSQLKDLERRLAEAKEPDRETDRQLAEVDGWRAHEDGEPDYAPLYTSSLDAAVSLVERVLPGRISDLIHQAWDAVSKKHALHMRLWKPETDGSYAQEMALALCLACVRALIAKGEK